MTSQKILQFAAEQTEAGNRVALLTVTATTGSSPAHPGQMMAVLADGTAAGTVGGGASEHELICRAVEAIGRGEVVFEFALDHSDNGMTCGGGMRGFGRVCGAGRRLLVFGGGHVAQKLVPLALSAGFAATVAEQRAEFRDLFPDAEYLLCTPEEYAQKLRTDTQTYAVICTRGHEHDAQALRYCLGKPLAYLGMIGSSGKVHTIFEQLRGEGVADSLLREVYSPIGLDIASSGPAEIAIAIMAEILLVKNGGSPRHKKLLP